MQFFIFVLIVCFFVFLYCVYTLGNDDFLFFRKDITMNKIFDIIFMGIFWSILTSRLFYGFSNTDIFSNPFVFFLFPYFPGLSLLGSVVGVAGYMIYVKYKEGKQFPVERIADFFSIAFSISLSIGFIGVTLFSEKEMMLKFGIEAGIYFVLFVLFLKLFLPRLLGGKIRDGVTTFIFLLSFSLINLVVNIFPKPEYSKYFKNFENIIFIIVFLVSIGMVIKLQKEQ